MSLEGWILPGLPQSADDHRVRDDLPTGTVTFLFTDVEGSTRLLHELGADDYAEALAEHRRSSARRARRGGVEVDTQGDAFFFAFPTAPGALAAAPRSPSARRRADPRARRRPHGDAAAHRRGLRRGRCPSCRPYRGGRPRRAGARLGLDRALVELELAISASTGSRTCPRRSASTSSARRLPAAQDLHQTNLPDSRDALPRAESGSSARCSRSSGEDVRLLTLTGAGGTGRPGSQPGRGRARRAIPRRRLVGAACAAP